MVTNEQKRIIIENLIESLELPEAAYKKAQKRYEDLGQWFDRDESSVAVYDPHIFPQGSFSLGTAIRPIDDDEEYDLDLACKFGTGITKTNHTQAQLKELIRVELEAYRKIRGIENHLEEKHRCWRLEYQDDLSFHMDIVPCIPADEEQRGFLFNAMKTAGLNESLATKASLTTVSITDDRHPNYQHLTNDWKISNPEGYAEWFRNRMKPTGPQLILAKAQIDPVPVFTEKTPLQRVIQILKRHRDNWSRDNPDVKPISIIITTLAARAYRGETDIVEALKNVLSGMGQFINPTQPRVPNPVDPEEDFADRWYRRDCAKLRLEENFYSWLEAAKIDFEHIVSTTDTKFLCEQANLKFASQIDPLVLKNRLRNDAGSINQIQPKSHSINRDDLPKPWSP